MARNRKVEIHRLTISGLNRDRTYGSFIAGIRNSIRNERNLAMEVRGRSHVLHRGRLEADDLRLLFYSFATGHRPDIINVDNFKIQETPLEENETEVNWTHVLGRRVGDRYLLWIERVQQGIWPSTIGEYLQWIVDENEEKARELATDNEPGEAITVSLEPEPSGEFIARVEALERITKVSIRIVRPNPGWADLDTELSGEANLSDARSAEVTFTARRRGTLMRDRGIVAELAELFRTRTLNFAAVEGKRPDGSDERFTTQNMVEKVVVSLPTSDTGQVIPNDAFQALSDAADEVE